MAYETEGGQRVVLAVVGMTCETCTTTVRMILNEVDGAEVADVTYEPPHATVDIDADRVTSEQLVVAKGWLNGARSAARLGQDGSGGTPRRNLRTVLRSEPIKDL